MLQGFAKHGEYVDFGESWLVYLTQQGGKKILVDGNEVIIGYSGSKEIFIKPDSVVQELTRGTKTHSHYEHTTTKETLNKEEYNKIVYGQYYDYDEGEHNYPSLEVEFEHRKKIQELKDNYQHVYDIKPDTVEDVLLTCVGDATPTGSLYISTALAYGKARFGNSGFYRVDWSAATAGILKEFLSEHDLHREYSNSDHSNVRFAKIKGNYILNDNIKGADKEKYGIYHSLDDAKEALEAHTKYLKNFLYVKVFGNNIVLDKATVGKVVADLESIQNCVNNLDVKQKSVSSKYSLVNKIKGLLEDYRKLVEGE